MSKRNKKNLTGGQSLCEVYNILTKEFGRFSTEPHKGSVPLWAGKMIQLSKKGEAPFAIIVPEEFDYPEEFTPITGAYEEFIKWAQDVNTSNDWYKYEEADKIFPSLFKKW